MRAVSSRADAAFTSSRHRTRARAFVRPSTSRTAACNVSIQQSFAMALDNRCLNRVTTGAALGAAVGGAVGACYGTYEAFAYKVPGMLKVRHIGRATVGSSALFGLFLSAGSLLQCGRR